MLWSYSIEMVLYLLSAVVKYCRHTQQASSIIVWSLLSIVLDDEAMKTALPTVPVSEFCR